jgi:hypothetical protein
MTATITLDSTALGRVRGPRLARYANPFRNPYRVMWLITFPVLAAGITLVAMFESPNRDAMFGWNPTHGAQSSAHWCAEWSLVQVSSELQAHADEYRTTAEYAELCGR